MRRGTGSLSFGMNIGMGGVGTKIVDPAAESPVAWYDFGDPSLLFVDAGITPVSSDGDSIYQASDKSGNGNHLTQTTVGVRPTYKTGIQNGLSVGRFDGINDVMLSALAQITGDKTIFLTYRKIAVGVGVHIMGSDIATGQFYGLNGTNFAYGRKGVAFDLTASSNEDTVTKVVTIALSGTAGRLLKDNAIEDSQTVADAAGGNYVFGALDLVSFFSNMDLMEVVIYDKALPSTSESGIAAYIQNRWSI